MKIGLIGLGRMGGNMTERLINEGHEVVVYDIVQDAVKAAAKAGAIPSTSIEELCRLLSGEERRVVWVMVPSGAPVEHTLKALSDFMVAGDIIIDGGNSYWKDTQVRAAGLMESKGLFYVDCGTSGGIWGLKNGYCLMYGGDEQACNHCEPIFKALAPKDGYVYCGASGAGHFVKMVHNGIEYGMMQAYAEGFELMEKSQYDLKLDKIANVWMQGSVVRSWLLELLGLALSDNDPKLSKLQDYVQDSGEGRWMVNTAIDLSVPLEVITTSLFARFRSRQDESFAMKIVAALRNEFGGHAVKLKEGQTAPDHGENKNKEPHQHIAKEVSTEAKKELSKDK